MASVLERPAPAEWDGEAFRREGGCVVRGLLDRAALADAEACFAWSVAHPSGNANEFAPTPDQPGRFYADINHPALLAPDSPYRRFLLSSGIGPALSAMWGGSDVWFLYEQVLLKEGAAARRTPWHQDLSYLPIAGEMLAIVWITLEPLAREHALEFVAGSHRGDLYDGSAFTPGDDTAPIYGDGTMPRLPEIEADRARWPIRGAALAPGDALLFHPGALHGGAPTPAGAARRTLSLRFFGEDAIYRPLPGDGVERIGIEGETIWKRLRGRLAGGDPLRDPGFAKIWPEAAWPA